MTSFNPKLLVHLIKASGKTKRFWKVNAIAENKALIEFGVENGKIRQEFRTVREGKQNRTLAQQLEMEVESMANKKRMRAGYVDHVNNNNSIEEQVITNINNNNNNNVHDEFILPNPMLAITWTEQIKQNLIEEINDYDLFIQPKLDGIRCFYDVHLKKLFSRSKKEILGLSHITNEFELLISKQKNKLPSAVRFVDGEIYLHGSHFQTITSIARRVVNKHEEAGSLEFHAFDLALEKENFSNRMNWLSELFVKEEEKQIKSKKIKLVNTKKVENKLDFFNRIDEILNQYIKEGYEGIILRKSLKPSLSSSLVDGYQFGKRSNNLIKHKQFKQEEFEVVELIKHREKEMVGAFVLKVNGKLNAKGLPLLFHAAPANNVELKAEMWKNKQQYLNGNFVATVKFHSFSDKFIPRFPVVVGFRHREDL